MRDISSDICLNKILLGGIFSMQKMKFFALSMYFGMSLQLQGMIVLLQTEERDTRQLYSLYECGKKEYNLYPRTPRTFIENYVFCASPKCCLPKMGCHSENCEKSCYAGSVGLPATGLVQKYFLCLYMYACNSGTYCSCDKIWFPANSVSYDCHACGCTDSFGICVARGSTVCCITGAVCTTCVGLNYLCKQCEK